MNVMRLRTSVPVLIGFSLLVSACSSLYEPKPQLTHVDGQTVLSNTASLSHVIIYNKKSNNYTCTQPAPDAAFNQGESADFSVSLVSFGGGKDSGEESESSEETEMSGRTPTVLMTRELFYRLCEFSKNHDLSKDEAKELYIKTLTTVKDVWKIEADKTTVKIGETVTTNNVTNVTSTEPVKLPAGNANAQTTITTQDACEQAGKDWDSGAGTCS